MRLGQAPIWGEVGGKPSHGHGAPVPLPSSLCCPSEHLLHPRGLRQDPPLSLLLCPVRSWGHRSRVLHAR